MARGGGEVDYERIVETAVHPFVLIDAAGTIVWVGRSFDELWGADASALVGRSVLDLLTPDGQKLAIEALANANDRTQAGAPGVWEGGAPQIDLLLPNGRTLACGLSVATPVRTGFDGYLVQLRRIGGQGRLDAALAAMAEGREVSTVLNHLAVMADLELPWSVVTILAGSEDGRFRTRFGAFAVLNPADVSRSAAVWRSQPVLRGTLLPAADLPAPLDELGATTGASTCWARAITARDQPTEVVGLLLAYHAAPWPMTAFTEVALQRITRFVHLALEWGAGRESLEYAATHDQLTGLLNRASFLRCLDTAVVEDEAGAVLYIDVDGFKQVNDKLGHLVGDEVLAVVASRVRATVKADDVVGRLGGDEFAVLSRGVDDVGAASVAERLIEHIAAPMRINGVAVQVGVSIGAKTLAGVLDGEAALKLADAALLSAKTSGKGTWAKA